MLSGDRAYRIIDDSYEEYKGEKRAEPVSKLMGLDNTYYVGRDTAVGAGFPLGRIGTVYLNGEEVTVVGFWNIRMEDDLLKPAVEALIKRWSWISNETTIVFGMRTKPRFLSDMGISVSGAGKPEEGGQEVCKGDDIINVDGQSMTLGGVLGNLHMVKGDQLKKIHTAFCGAEKGLRQKFQQSGCNNQLNIVNSISSRFKQNNMHCGEEWGSLLQKGKFAYKQGVKDVFHKAADAAKDGEDYLGNHFRTQKEIDAAWDYLYKREHTLGFREWLNGIIKRVSAK